MTDQNFLEALADLLRQLHEARNAAGNVAGATEDAMHRAEDSRQSTVLLRDAESAIKQVQDARYNSQAAIRAARDAMCKAEDTMREAQNIINIAESAVQAVRGLLTDVCDTATTAAVAATDVEGKTIKAENAGNHLKRIYEKSQNSESETLEEEEF